MKDRERNTRRKIRSMRRKRKGEDKVKGRWRRRLEEKAGGLRKEKGRNRSRRKKNE